MMSGSKETEKQYGLINMKKTKSSSQPLQKKLAIFDESDEEETPQSSINQKLQQEAVKTKMRKQTKMEIQKAMEEDPTVFEYDSIYDDMEQKKQERERLIKSKQRDSKPKYIAGLMKAANQRKMERERQKERKIQKEREKEGEEFGDKEQFVTASYKKKMQELAEDEERERREAERDGDVTKNMDMTGFYRHILEQTTGEVVGQDKNNVAVKRESSLIIKPKEEEDGRDERRHSRDIETRDRDKSREDSKHHNDTYRGDERRQQRERHREEDRSHERDRTRDKDRGNKRESERDYRKDRDRKDRDNQGQDNERKRDKDRDKYDRSKSTVSEGKKYTSEENTEGEERLRVKDKEIGSVREREDSGQKENKNEDDMEMRGRKDEEVNEDADSDLDISEESEEETEKDSDTDGDKEERKDSKREESIKRVDKLTEEEKVKLKYSKRTTTDTVMSARDRYLARKMQRDAEKSHISLEDDSD